MIRYVSFILTREYYINFEIFLENIIRIYICAVFKLYHQICFEKSLFYGKHQIIQMSTRYTLIKRLT